MPFAPKRACRCGQLVPAGQRCPRCTQQYEQARSQRATRQLYTWQWHKYSKNRLKQYPLCVYCERDKRVTPATLTDHIKPHRGDYALFWDESNHASLCTACHSSKKQQEESAAPRARRASVMESTW